MAYIAQVEESPNIFPTDMVKFSTSRKFGESPKIREWADARSLISCPELARPGGAQRAGVEGSGLYQLFRDLKLA
jgi:hypothetical protein